MQDRPRSERVEEPEPIHTVLIVEDDVSIGEILVQLFRDETSYQVIHVLDGCAALKMVRTVIPSLILLDYQLPNIDGLECLEALRAIKQIENTPIILMSANVPKQARERKDILILEKPFDLEDVLRLVQRTLTFQRVIHP